MGFYLMLLRYCCFIGLLTILTSAQRIEKCASPIDLVFALDASGSVRPAGFKEIKDFTKKLVDGFNIGATGTHVGVLTFSEYGKVQIRLTDTYDKPELFRKIDNLEYPAHRTNTSGALKVAGKDMFSLEGGARQGVPQVLILLTDGKCTVCDSSGVRPHANKLKDQGITIYTVGVTDSIDRKELEEISSDPSESHMFDVSDFYQLQTIIAGLQERTCEVKKGKCMKPPQNPICQGLQLDLCRGDGNCPGDQKCCFNGCHRSCSYPLLNCLTAIDIAFAIDSSSSVTRTEYKKMKSVASRIAESFAVSPQEARFGTIIYSGKAEMKFNFVKYDTSEEVSNAILSLPHIESDTRVDQALSVAKSDLFSLKGNVRTRRPMVLIIFFDGDVSKDMRDLEEVASPLKDYGVKIVAISVSSEINLYQVNKVASAPSLVYNASNFDAIIPKLFNIARDTCTNKFGECPADPYPIAPEDCGIANLDECDSDFNCPGNSKCCRRGCKNVCVDLIKVCKRKLDIAFVLNNNLQRGDFEIAKNYMNSVVDQFEIGDDKSHIALMRFGPEPEVVFDFNSNQSSNYIVKSRIEQLQYQRGRGPLSSALVYACDAIFCKLGGTRLPYHKLMIIITGSSSPSDDRVLQEQVRTLRRRGVDILVIGAGSVNTEELQKITSDEESMEDRVMLARDYSGIMQYVKDIPTFACSAAATTPLADEIEGKCQPKSCIKGEKGSRGRPGDVGPVGYDGTRGDPGPRGLRGPKGKKGPNGAMGSKGIRGDPGVIGLPGFPGYNGIPGVPGEIGRPGKDGDCGLPGKSGDAGLDGLDGFVGPVGRPGPLGTKGRKGEPARINPNLRIFPGDKGEAGVDGEVDRKGRKGEDGPNGYRGDAGFDGEPGMEGDAGEKGDAGTFVMRKGERGEQGDAGPSGTHFFELKKNPDLGELKGNEGSKGSTGAKGPDGQAGNPSTNKGRKGQRGDQGPKGFDGYRGSPGEEGRPGDFGERGLPGAKGFKGIEGTTGFPGGQGEPGDQGPSGLNGPKGEHGEDAAPKEGARGKKGVRGDDGYPGREGAIGLKGLTGPKGREGEMLIGPVGDPGGVGRRGPNGRDGLPGVVGMEGFRGRKGSKGEPGQSGDQGRHAEGVGGTPGMDGPPGSKGATGPIGNTGFAGKKGQPIVIRCDEKICPKGKKGESGAPGDPGPPGVLGPSGPTGPKGYSGGPCPLCPPGVQGRSGEPGNPGTIGLNGEKGIQGDIGEFGRKGQKGEVGSTGFNGLKGKKGPIGDVGQIGRNGDDSPGNSFAPKGLKGLDGAPGSPGVRGRNGVKGEKGKIGNVGPTGERGKRGIKGLSGPTGRKGFDGETGRPGSVGDSGDSTTGPRGFFGNRGRQGQQGPTGDRGFKGRKGRSGSAPTQAQIDDAMSKLDDYKGDPGPRGDLGDLGIKGEEGPEGLRGPKGERGYEGPKGYGGVKGDTGRKGRAGDDGDPGNSGFPGRNGRQGISGDPGKPGKKGEAPKGYKGSSGVAGRDGLPGKDSTSPLGCVGINDPTDIAFILDSSRSVTGDDFDRQKEFIKNFLKRFPIGVNDTRAGIIKYGRTATIEISFDQYMDESSLSNAIDNIRHSRASESRLDAAIQVANNQLFTIEKGMRKFANKALVLLGDGFISGGNERSTTLQNRAKADAEKLKQEGVTVFALGVGAERNKFLLLELVSDPSYYLEIESYSNLLTKIYDFKSDIQETCTYAGEPGKDGLPGIPGDDGDRGDKGKDGRSPKGYIGSRGPIGQDGETVFGVTGRPGDSGYPGPQGERGISGRDGFERIGRDGPKGAKGEPAENVMGPTGDKGERGIIGPQGPQSQTMCNNVLATDFAFVLDTSSSVGINNFNKMKDFVKSIVRAFDVDNQLTRVSVITFDEDARLDIPLYRHNTLNQLLENIDRLNYGNGRATRTDKALLAVADAFLERNGARDDVNKALVFMTDGQQSYASDQRPIPEVMKPLIDAKVLRYAIGIGREIAPTELNDIAGENNVIYGDDFDQLKLKILDLVRIIAKRGCKGEPGPPGRDGPDGLKGRNGFPGTDGRKGENGQIGLIGLKGRKGMQGDSLGFGYKGVKGEPGDLGPPGLPACDKTSTIVASDIVFLLDASGSLYPEGFKREKDFVKNVIDRLGTVSRDGIRIGVISYSDEANIRVKLDEYFDNDSLKQAIDDIPFDSKGTRIDLGFKEAKKLFSFNEKLGARGSSKKVLILLTDGQQTYVPRVTEPTVVAKELITDGVDVFSIGIGSEIDRVELESFISKPQFLFLATDLVNLVNELGVEVSTALTCEEGPRGEPGEKGEYGITGPQGSIGDDGRQGRQGPPGDPGFGPRGEQGIPGPLGRNGEAGDKGFRGPVGSVGEVGLRGPDGYLGLPGLKGDRGTPGFIGNEGFEGSVGDKGVPGESFFGQRGPKGNIGPKGYRGPPGESFALPPGNEPRDYKGDKGPVGDKGFIGRDGPPGRLLVAPGETGVQGEKGEVGGDGSFGPRGPPGFPGSDGKKGMRGASGNDGNDGKPGRKGISGESGPRGDRGFQGRSQKGEKGELGRPGDIGSLGPFGIKGNSGIIGMPGKKGSAGFPGFPGRTPKPQPGDEGPKGYPGRKGEEGDRGKKGARGAIPLEGDLKGQRGDQGPTGFTGDKGERGLRIDGRKGSQGPPGLIGFKGNRGDQGDTGRKGPPGDLTVERGDVGSNGLKGLIGRPGRSGKPGSPGERGNRGVDGYKGPPGNNGFPGLRGDQGPTGDLGDPGPLGSKGAKGQPGRRGRPGPNDVAEGFHIVRHSQADFEPLCPRNYKRMWGGYSLMYTVGNGRSHSQDLGDPGSCSKSFSTMPFLFCDISGSCKYAQRNDFVYWLSGEVQQPMMPVSNVAIEPFISRCVVCEAPSIHIAVHSQDTVRPDCPRGWESLWHGFSFLMVAGAGKTGAGQSLSSSGSCLEMFRPKPFIECQGARGTCHFFSDKYSFWLTTINPRTQFETQQPQTLIKDKGDDLKSRVSRCRVCIRSKRASPDPSDGSNNLFAK